MTALILALVGCACRTSPPSASLPVDTDDTGDTAIVSTASTADTGFQGECGVAYSEACTRGDDVCWDPVPLTASPTPPLPLVVAYHREQSALTQAGETFYTCHNYIVRRCAGGEVVAVGESVDLDLFIDVYAVVTGERIGEARFITPEQFEDGTAVCETTVVSPVDASACVFELYEQFYAVYPHCDPYGSAICSEDLCVDDDYGDL